MEDEARHSLTAGGMPVCWKSVVAGTDSRVLWGLLTSFHGSEDGSEGSIEAHSWLFCVQSFFSSVVTGQAHSLQYRYPLSTLGRLVSAGFHV